MIGKPSFAGWDGNHQGNGTKVMILLAEKGCNLKPLGEVLRVPRVFLWPDAATCYRKGDTQPR